VKIPGYPARTLDADPLLSPPDVSCVGVQYIEVDRLMGSSYTPDSVEWWFQARGESRHQQSVAAITDALFPPGSGLDTFPGRRQPIPYFSWDKGLDPVLHPPKLCQAARYRDDARWTATKGAQTVANNLEKVRTISRICGYDILSARTPSAALKDIADGFGFLTYEGLEIKSKTTHAADPPPRGHGTESLTSCAVSAVLLCVRSGMSDWSSVSKMITQFSYDMFVDRLFGTPEQATYWAGDYPRNVAARMLQMVNRRFDDRGDPPRKFLLYTASRELLFGLSFFFGLDLHVPDPNTPTGAMPPGDAIVFELAYGGRCTDHVHALLCARVEYVPQYQQCR
jgi:hypothetical protein